MTITSAQPARRPDPVSYGPLSADTVTGYLAGLGAVARRLGGHAGQWRATERGDGNLNLVFIVEGSLGRGGCQAGFALRANGRRKLAIVIDPELFRTRRAR